MLTMPHFNPAPATLHEVLDPAWLSAMLAPNWPGARVTDVTVVEVLATQATKVRIALTIEGRTDAPRALCIKGVLTDTGAVPAASIVETLFYREAAAALPVTVPPCIHASLDADGVRGVIVMNDLIAAGGSFCTALEPFTPDQAADGLTQLARLHATSWGGVIARPTPWVISFLDRISHQPIMPLAMLQSLLDGPRGARLDPAARDAARLQQALERLAAEVRSGPRCFVHGDAHAGNVYRQADGTLGLVDWQILQTGNWAQDVAYHLAAVLTPEVRRSHERTLLDDYLARLKAAGGPELDREEAWRQYRVAVVYGYYLWSITRKVDADIIEEFVHRLGTAAHDLGSFALLRA
jgi:hypothetical protein